MGIRILRYINTEKCCIDQHIDFFSCLRRLENNFQTLWPETAISTISALVQQSITSCKITPRGQTICTIQTILYMMIYCDILRTMKKTKKYDASNCLCVLALFIHCFEILILLARHGDSKSDFWRYTLVHNFCPPLSWTIEIKLL